MNPFAFVRYAAFSIAFTALTALSACSDKDSPAGPTAPETITFNQPALYPESVSYDAAGNRFLVGSLTAGALGQVQVDGAYSLFADDAQLVSTTGVLVDEPRSRVLVAVGDLATNSARTSPATQYKLAALASYDRSTGRRLAYVDLGSLRPGASHIASDIAVDGQGNTYVTDSFAPIIYKVDMQGMASIFLEDSRLAAPTGAFGLNGIVFHPDGYLLVAKSDEGVLYKVPLATPSAFTRVASNIGFANADGLLLDDNNTLLIASNGQPNVVLRVRTNDGWSTATGSGVFAAGDVFPTSLARRGADVYVLQSYLSALFSGQNPPVAQFGLRMVKF